VLNSTGWPSALHRATGLRPAALVFLSLGLISMAMALNLYADDLTALGANVQAPEAIPAPRWNDPEDRLMTGQLKPAAELKSQANALYAQAMLLPEGLASEQQTALEQLRQVLSLDPLFTDAQVKVATLLLQMGQIEPALGQLHAALAVNPGSITLDAMLAYAQHLHGQNDDALRLAKHVLTGDPTNATAMRVMLDVARDQADLAGGVLHVEDILENRGSGVPASAWLTLASLYLEIARGDANTPAGQALLKIVLPIYAQAAAKPPPAVETLTLLADTYRDLGQKRDALKTLQQAAALAPSNVDIVLHCADLENELGQQVAALKNYEKAYALNPSLTGLRETLGGLYLDNGRFVEAAALIQQPDPYLKLAAAQLTSERLKEAGLTLAAAQARFPKSAKVRFYQAIQLSSEKKYAAALDSLKQARALATGGDTELLDPQYYLETSLIMNLAGQKDGIEATLREGMSKFPENADLMNELAYFWANHGIHLSEALALSQRAVELAPDNGPIQDTQGWVFFRMGEAKDALPYLQRAALLTNNDPVVLQHVGDAYLKLGLRSEAIAAWRRGLEKDPRNGDLANRIDAAMAQANNAHLRSAPNP